MEEKKAKKGSLGIIICSIIIALLVIALGGMYYYYNFVSNGNNAAIGNEIKSSKNINKQINNKELVYNVKTKIMAYNYIDDKEEEKEVEVPQINLNYDNIKTLNDKIIKYTKEWGAVGYDVNHYINDGIISLVMTYYTEGDPYNFFVFNIDTYTGNILTNEELLYKIGIPNDLDERLESAVGKVLEENTLGEEFDPEGTWYFASKVCNDYSRELQTTIPMFLNEDGNLSVIVQYCAPAGSGGPWGVIIEL